MGKLTTHVLDTAHGRPGAGIKIELFALAGDTRRALKTALTNADGRCDAPLLQDDAFVTGEYELAFHVADFYAPRGTAIGDPVFLDKVVPLRFSIFDAKQHYHVPLLCTPWSCSTYRGS